jgi:hypothetical protein
MSAPLSLVKIAYIAFCQAMLPGGLMIDARESELYTKNPALQSTKLAIYCSNARFSYFNVLHAIPLDLSLALIIESYFNCFTVSTIHFESVYDRFPVAIHYRKALRQQPGSLDFVSNMVALGSPALPSLILQLPM